MRISDWSSDVCSSDLATMVREVQSYRGIAEENMAYSVEDVDKFKSGKYPWTHPNTDWFSTVIKDYSKSDHYSFRVSGGTKDVKRSEERRVGKECVSTCRSRRSRYH